MSLSILLHFLCAQHVSDINISIIRSLRLFCWITTLFLLFLVLGSVWLGWIGIRVAGSNTDTTPTQPHRNANTHQTMKNMTNVVIQQTSRKLLMMDILMSETFWAHKKWNKIASDIKLVFYSSTKQIIINPHIKPLCIKLCTQHYIIWQTVLLKGFECEILWMCEVTCDKFIAHRTIFRQIVN